MLASRPIRPLRAAAAVLLGLASFAMANAVDYGFTRSWPDWARGAWALALITGMIASVLLFGTSAGWLNNSTLAARGNRSGRVPTVRTFVLVYVGALASGLFLSFLLEWAYGIPGERTTLAFCGFLFLACGLGRPWWLYETVRRLGWFAAIQSDTLMRGFLTLIGVVFTAGALLG